MRAPTILETPSNLAVRYLKALSRRLLANMNSLIKIHSNIRQLSMNLKIISWNVGDKQ